MKKLLKATPLIWLICIVTFVTNNNSEYQAIWDLGYYLPYYLVVFGFVWFMWHTFESKLTRALLVPLVVYYLFHLCVQMIEIISPELKDIIYTGKTVNYLLALSLSVSIIIFVVAKRKKK